MGLNPRAVHELRIVKKIKGAYVNYRSKAVYLGPWDAKSDSPSDAAVKRFEELRALWRVDPLAAIAPEPLLIEVWDDWLRSPQGPRGRPEDTRRVRRTLFGSDGSPGTYYSTPASQFRPSDFMDWQTSLCDRGLSRWTVGQCRRLVLACFDWASVKGTVDELHPAALARVKPPGRGHVKEAESRMPCSEADFLAVRPFLRPAALAAVELIWFTGARPSEVLTLRPADIVRSGSIRTAKGIDFALPAGVWAAVRKDHKLAAKGFDRVLFFGPEGQGVLDVLLEGAHPDRSMFLTQRRRAYTGRTICDALERACARAKIPAVTPYALRHGAAVAAQQQFSEAETGAWLGHRSRAVTARYSGSDLRTAARVALACG